MLELQVFANLKVIQYQWHQNWYMVTIVAYNIAFWWFTCAVSAAIASGTPWVESFILGWAGLWNHVQDKLAFWMLMLLLPCALLLPQ